MFPTLDCLGWYSTGVTQNSDYPDVKDDLRIQKSIQRFCESPIYLIMNTGSEQAKNKKQVPIFLYETNTNSKTYESLDFSLAQSEDERIAVDNVAKAVDQDAKKSTTSTNLISLVNAVKLLRSKIKFLVDIFKNSPEVQNNPEFARRLAKIVNQLSLLNESAQETEKNFESSFYSDVAALNMLATATKGFSALQQLSEEIKVIQRGNKTHGNMGIFNPNLIVNQ